jgi:putative transcriptional regulator
VYDIVRYQITSLERSVETCYTIKTKKRTIILNDENKTGGKKKMLRYKIDILEALKEKGYTSYKIRKDKLIGEAQLTKIRSGEIASKETLNTICRLLSCQPGDILEYVEIDNK